MNRASNPEYVAQVERRAFYFGPDHAPLFGWLHTPRTKPSGQMGMVLCPPLGNHYDYTYPVLRHLADRLAYHGIPVLRFDYSGMGNSSGLDIDPDRVDSWLRDIRDARAALSSVAGCSAVGLLGVRMGGLLAAKFSHDTALPCLVLWGTAARGRSYVREMRAIYLTSESSQNTSLDENSDIEAGGFIFTSQTLKNLASISFDSIVPNAERILIAARDDLPGDQVVPKAWLNVEQCVLPGFSGMLTPPHDSHYRIPFTAIDRLEQWILDAAQSTNSRHQDIKGALQRCILPHTAGFIVRPDAAHAKVRENIFHFGENLARFAITTEPYGEVQPDSPWVIISSSGADHTGGQIRLSVLLSRALALAGVRCVRFDFPGVGDSIVASPALENKTYQTSNSVEIASLIEALQQNCAAQNFVLMGLCAGAFASFHGGLELKQLPVAECLLLNPLIFYWEEGMNIDEPPLIEITKQQSIEQHNRWQYYIGQAREFRRWKNLLTGKSDLRPLIRAISYKGRNALNEYVQSWTGKSSTYDDDPLTRDINGLCESGRLITFVFARSDHGYGLLMSHAGAIVRYYMRKKRVKIWFIDRSSHSFTNRASRLQLINSVVSHLVQRYGSK